jgi:5-methylcytosine-specific restriction enzyme subunit McrC
VTGGRQPLPLLEIAEWQGSLLAGAVLSRTDRRLAETLAAGGRLDIDELRTGVRVRARSWVGVVRFEGFELRIVPKLAGGNLGLVRMIEFATGLDALRRSPGARGLEAGGSSLLDLIALLLAEQCESILRGGLLADYVEREDDLPVLRGRLLADRQVRKRFGRVDRLACRFDEHEQDTIENRLLARALTACARTVADGGVRRRVRKALAVFAELCSPDALDLEAARGAITYHRLNEHYRDAHELAWLALDGLGVAELLAGGRTRSFAFLIDMNRLFERFVFRLVERLMSRIAYRVQYQRADRSIIWDAARNQPYSRVVPDILVESPDQPARRLAVDAKYKLYDDRGVAASDVYQNFLYAYAFGGGRRGDLPAALLIYPSSAGARNALHLHVQSAKGLAGARVHALGLPIPDALDEVERGAGGPVTGHLVASIRRAAGGAIQTVV